MHKMSLFKLHERVTQFYANHEKYDLMMISHCIKSVFVAALN